MVENAVVAAVQRYLAALPAVGIHPTQAVLFGSYARGEAHQWSDIDVVVIAPEFDLPTERKLITKLWDARGSADIRIEPIPCGVHEWETDGSRPVLEIARHEGVVISVADQAAGVS